MIWESAENDLHVWVCVCICSICVVDLLGCEFARSSFACISNAYVYTHIMYTLLSVVYEASSQGGVSREVSLLSVLS